MLSDKVKDELSSHDRYSKTAWILKPNQLFINGFLKRFADLFISIIGLVFLLPFCIVIALLIKCEAPRLPILFRQDRIGKNGETFRIFKFRTMTCLDNGDCVQQAQKNDIRVTKVGHFLRQTSIDELPQLLNVIAGSMSICGPRPHAVAHDRLYAEQIKGYRRRQSVLPGITGWAQIHGYRGETDTLLKMQQRVKYDLWYTRNQNILLDMYVVMKTIPALFHNKDVY